MSKESDSGSRSLTLKSILQKHEQQLIDFEHNICILCKRRFKDGDEINRHRSLSKLHNSRLKRLRQRLFTGDQLERLERKEREALYRDRARERRLKYGNSDRVIPVEPHFSVPPTASSPPAAKIPAAKPRESAPKPLGSDNKGAALLSKMGWKEGTGLGRTSEGITDIIRLDSQVGTSGLGSKNYRVDPSLSYKDAVKQIMYQRYHELKSEEENT